MDKKQLLKSIAAGVVSVVKATRALQGESHQIEVVRKQPDGTYLHKTRGIFSKPQLEPAFADTDILIVVTRTIIEGNSYTPTLSA